MNSTDQFTPAEDAPPTDTTETTTDTAPYDTATNPEVDPTTAWVRSGDHAGGYTEGNAYNQIEPRADNTRDDGPKWEAQTVSDSEGALELPHPHDPNKTVKFVGGAKPGPTQVHRYDGVWNPVTGQAVWTCGRCGLAFSMPGVEHRDTVGRVCEPFLDPELNLPTQVDPGHAGDTQAVHSGRVVVGGAHVLAGQDVRTFTAGPTPQVAAAAAIVAAGGALTGPGGEQIAAHTAFGGYNLGAGPSTPPGGPLATAYPGAIGPPINPIINAGPGLATDAPWEPAPNQPTATSAFPDNTNAPSVAPPPSLESNPGGSSSLSAGGQTESNAAYRSGEGEKPLF